MKRREFMCGALAAGAAVGVGDLIGQEAGSKGSNAGIIFKAVKAGEKTSPEKLAEIKALGFDGVEGSAPMVDAAAYLERTEAAGLPVHGVVDQVHWKQRLSDPDAAVREVGRAALEQSLKDAHFVGGSSVLLVPGRVSGDEETHEDVWARSIVEIRKVLPTASRLGIQILIETVWNGFCYDPIQLRDYIDEINSPWVKVYLDFGNMQKYAPGDEWVRVLGNRIVKLDVKDWGEANGFCPLGEGDVDWVKLREALAEIGFTGWATREGNDKGLENTARLMNELLDL
ncbi:MAG: sugar phosphate isomerase/epimerase family protein [Verrucomicrobiota bacterium]